MGSTASILEIFTETFAAVKRTQKNWMFYAVYLLPLVIVGDLLTTTAVAQHTVDPSVSAFSLPGSVFSFIPAVLMPYLFTATYLQKEPVMAPVTPSFGNYFYWLWSLICRFLLIPLLPMAILGLFAVVAGKGAHDAIHNDPAVHGATPVITPPVVAPQAITPQAAAAVSHAVMTKAALGILAGVGIIGILIFIVIMFISIYPALRLYCVGPLAICRDPTPIRTSWRITKGQCWKIFLNALVVFLTVGLTCGLLPFLLEWFLANKGNVLYADHYTTALTVFVISSTLIGITKVLLNAILGVFMGVMLRAIYRDAVLAPNAKI